MRAPTLEERIMGYYTRDLEETSHRKKQKAVSLSHGRRRWERWPTWKKIVVPAAGITSLGIAAHGIHGLMSNK